MFLLLQPNCLLQSLIFFSHTHSKWRLGKLSTQNMKCYNGSFLSYILKTDKSYGFLRKYLQQRGEERQSQQGDDQGEFPPFADVHRSRCKEEISEGVKNSHCHSCKGSP